MEIKRIKFQTIADLAAKRESFISAMKKCKEKKPEQWNEYFDGSLDPETMQPVSGCNTIKDKCYLIRDIRKFLPPEIQDRIWGNKYILFFAVFWSENESPDDIAHVRDRLNTRMSSLKSKSKKTGNRKKNQKKFHDS